MYTDLYDGALPEPYDDSPLERTKRRQAFWAKVWRDPLKDLAHSGQVESWHAHRIAFAYRVVREIARIKGLIFDNEAVSELLNQDDFTAWVIPVEPQDPKGHIEYEANIMRREIPLLPPTEKSKYFGHLGAYFDTVNEIVIHLGITGTEDGRRGYVGMTDILHYERMWPTLEEILTYENKVVHEVVSLVSSLGAMRARNEMIVKHSLRRWEVNNLFAVAINGAVEMMSGTVEEERAVMLLRLEDLLKRCQEEGDLRAELAGYKLISHLQNLTKAKSADDVSEMVDVVRAENKRVEAEEKQKGIRDG